MDYKSYNGQYDMDIEKFLEEEEFRQDQKKRKEPLSQEENDSNIFEYGGRIEDQLEKYLAQDDGSFFLIQKMETGT